MSDIIVSENVEVSKSVVPGMVFGRLTTIERFRKNGRAYWHCTCECGNEKDIRQDAVQSGVTISCGCIRIERARAATTTHGMNGTPEYRSWQHMKVRCLNPNDNNFKHYGGRGITICDEWKSSFTAFFADMGKCPEGCSLDRIDVNGNYEPSNCRWADNATQARNTTQTILITYSGKTQCLADWANEIGISFSGLQKRLTKMSIEQALTTPLSKKHSSRYRDQEHEHSIH